MKPTNAELLREEARTQGFAHSNKWWRKYMMEKFGRNISVQQISAVLGRYRDRPLADLRGVHECARRYLVACGNDYSLASRVLAEYRTEAQ